MIEECLSALTDPLGPVRVVEDQGSRYSVVTAADCHVLWRFVCEKSVMRLEAAPIWAPQQFFDADLLARCFLGHGVTDVHRDPKSLMTISIEDLVAELARVREPVMEAFQQGNWAATRTRLTRLAHERDFELFGRPIPPDGAA
jgi:hypothetical protein